MSQKVLRKVVLPIVGMHCASCAQLVETKLQTMPGIKQAVVSFGTEKATLEYDEASISLAQIAVFIEKLGYKAMLPDQAQPEIKTQKHKLFFIVPAMIFSLILMLPTLSIFMHLVMWLNFVLATIFIFWIGQDYLKAVGRFCLTGVSNMDTLVGLGSLTAYVYSSIIFLFPRFSNWLHLPQILYFDAAILVISFIFIGKYLELKAKASTNEAIEKLMQLQMKTALVEVNGLEKEVPIEQLQIGDIVIIKPGSKVPIDGKIIEGETAIDEALITGEAMPVDKTVGDLVVGGTINLQGYVKMTVLKIGQDTLLAQIIKAVEEVQSSKAPIQKIADRVSGVFVPVVMIIAALTLVIWLAYGALTHNLALIVPVAISSFVAVLVIACPCALGLATPLGIIVGTGLASKQGILIKNAESLEKLCGVTTVVFDKTGTITKGVPDLTDILPFQVSEAFKVSKEGLLIMLASLESKSEHPLAKAIVAHSLPEDLLDVTAFRMIGGRGVEGVINGMTYYAGNLKLLEEKILPAALTEQFRIKLDTTIQRLTATGKTPIIFFTSQFILGIVGVADSLKGNSKAMIFALQRLNLKTVMLTGDHENVARYIADQVGIDDVVAEVHPQDKAEIVKRLIRENRQSGGAGYVAMVGDGINDAPALALADVSIAMATGSDIAIEAADITLLNGDLEKILKAIKISKLTMRKIKQNLFWAFIYNLVLIPIACGLLYIPFGITLNPILAGLAMSLSSISVVLNTLLMRFKVSLL